MADRNEADALFATRRKKRYYTRADLCTTTRSIKIRESDAQIRLHIFC